MSGERLTPEALQALAERSPFHRWLGVAVTAVEADAIEMRLPWRAEFVSNPDRGYAHGGILAALIDLAADFAIAAALGRGVPTVDMRVDYHRTADAGELTARARVVKLGSTVSTAEAEIRDGAGRLIASGRGTYLTTRPS